MALPWLIGLPRLWALQAPELRCSDEPSCLPSFHFDSSQFPAPFSVESQNPGMKLQEPRTPLSSDSCQNSHTNPSATNPDTPRERGLWSWPGPAFGFFLLIRTPLWHGYLLKAGPMSHADECHSQLLADSVELTLRFLCQGTGGFIEH